MRTQSICLALATIPLCPFASAQWVQTNGPYGGTVNCLAVSGMNIFVGIVGEYISGVYVSTNNGASWTSLDKIPTRISYLRSLGVSGTSLFVGTDEGGVFLSTNNGTS